MKPMSGSDFLSCLRYIDHQLENRYIEQCDYAGLNLAFSIVETAIAEFKENHKAFIEMLEAHEQETYGCEE